MKQIYFFNVTLILSILSVYAQGTESFAKLWVSINLCIASETGRGPFAQWAKSIMDRRNAKYALWILPDHGEGGLL